MLLSGLMRNVAITGNTDTINAWFGSRQAGRWAVRTAASAMPTPASVQRLKALDELRARGDITDAEYERLRARG
jgi:putative oligomerization/nucleic acid binding protein